MRPAQGLHQAGNHVETSAKFSGKYAHRTISGGVGHNLPQEAPEAFTEAVIEVDGWGS